MEAVLTGESAPVPKSTDAAPLDALLGETLGVTAYNIAVHAARGDDAVFFVSDSVRAREAVRRRYPSVITTDARIMHVGNDFSDAIVQAAYEAQRRADFTVADGMRDVLVDWWLLASADIRVGSLISGFMRSAAVASATGAYDQGEGCQGGYECCIGDHLTLSPCFIPLGSGT